MSPSITTLFVDVGGVLLTNAWDHIARIVGWSILRSIRRR